MKYVGIQKQITKNNVLSLLLLLLFPCLLLAVTYGIIAFTASSGHFTDSGMYVDYYDSYYVNSLFIEKWMPYVLIGTAVWFIIAYLFNASMIKNATKARPLERKDNPRVYNIVENLCMTCNMNMPAINVVDDDQLNAFASGINEKTYTVTLTTGIIDRLDDDELAGVIGHELTHIRNKDTRLLITSIIFVGIISTLVMVVYKIISSLILFSGNLSGKKDKGAGCGLILSMVVVMVLLLVAYLFTSLTRFAISRKREYMADAGGAELCGNPLALASALRKISNNPGLMDVGRDDIAQMYIFKPREKGCSKALTNLFETHPDIEDRIKILEQF